jgi:hypothetical protein
VSHLVDSCPIRLRQTILLGMAPAIGAVMAWSALALSPGSSAQAHFSCPDMWHGTDYACVYSDHQETKTCDQEADGNGVRIRYKRPGSSTQYTGPWAPSQGCVVAKLAHDGQYFKVCEEREGCSDWSKHY